MLRFHRLSQMSLGERNTRPGFQIAFEGKSPPLVGTLNHDINGPRTMLGRVITTACVVLAMSCRHIGGDARVVLRRSLVVPEHVHEPFRHDRGTSKPLAARNLKTNLDDCGLARSGSDNGGCHEDWPANRSSVRTLRQSTFASWWRELAGLPSVARSRFRRAKDGTGTGICERLEREVPGNCCMIAR